jgi:hypothetical protein
MFIDAGEKFGLGEIPSLGTFRSGAGTALDGCQVPWAWVRVHRGLARLGWNAI